ncbi:hypothetical protein [Synechococcus sp. BIOS-E4-1]|uniref:hypothetical protein n=1 Tax=Synechococcus sp. BIOS-E4-1 TaxID=1400864 RepID=UPI00164816F7|nr:hypothetical protein [Synechococcus sp. BIOS-E4-1]
MAKALMLPKKWNRLEVQSSMAFLLGSILFVTGSITQLQNQWIFKTLFMLGSVLFLTGSLTQLWQTFRAWRRQKKYILISLSLALVGVIGAKAGTLFFNADSISDWLNLNLATRTRKLLGPDAYMAGSFMFLISGIAHYAEIGHGRLVFVEKNHLGWWVCFSFLVGSALYCLSALHGYDTAINLPFGLSSEKNSILLCLIASAIFIFMSLCSLAECSENETNDLGCNQ